VKELIVVNFEEIYLKGQNQKFFADRLRAQLKEKLRPFKEKIRFSHRRGGSMFIDILTPLTPPERELILEIIRRTPGVTGVYTVVSVPPRKEEIIQAALEMARAHLKPGASFRITARRLKKTLPFTSRDLAREAGAAIVEALGNPVNLTAPDWHLHIKVRADQALLYDDIRPGIGGLPVGSSGRAVALLSGGIDSPVAAQMMINRGMALTAVHFHAMPRTSPRSVEKVRDLARVLSVYQPEIRLALVPVLDIQEAIARHTDSKLRLVLLRRFMLRIASELAAAEGALALITGDSLGQVASQTLENMQAISAVTDRLILRPLVGLDKKEIIRRAREAGTYDISILPHDDACAMFTPDHPETKAHPGYTDSQWQRLPVEELIRRALERTEWETFRFDPALIAKWTAHVSE